MQAWQRDVIRLAASEGVERARIEFGGKHLILVGAWPDGRSVRHPLASTPSDWRSAKNLRRDLRRARVHPPI